MIYSYAGSQGVKQLSVGIGLARKQSKNYLSLTEVDIVWWPVAAKPHKPIITFNNSVVQMQLNCHKCILPHHRTTWWEYCRKLVSNRCTATLQKPRRITESHSSIHAAWSCSKCMNSCSSGIRRAALGCRATLKFYVWFVHHAVLKCENSTDVIAKGIWHAH